MNSHDVSETAPRKGAPKGQTKKDVVGHVDMDMDNLVGDGYLFSLSAIERGDFHWLMPAAIVSRLPGILTDKARMCAYLFLSLMDAVRCFKLLIFILK